MLKTDKFYSDASYASDDIVKINQNLDSEKAHDHDKTSIGMLKICASSIFKPLGIISASYFENWKGKKANVATVHKKMTSNFLKLTDQSHYFHYVKYRDSILFPGV